LLLLLASSPAEYEVLALVPARRHINKTFFPSLTRLIAFGQHIRMHTHLHSAVVVVVCLILYDFNYIFFLSLLLSPFISFCLIFIIKLCAVSVRIFGFWSDRVEIIAFAAVGVGALL
jgi:hypothetical protein